MCRGRDPAQYFSSFVKGHGDAEVKSVVLVGFGLIPTPTWPDVLAAHHNLTISE